MDFLQNVGKFKRIHQDELYFRTLRTLDTDSALQIATITYEKIVDILNLFGQNKISLGIHIIQLIRYELDGMRSSIIEEEEESAKLFRDFINYMVLEVRYSRLFFRYVHTMSYSNKYPEDFPFPIAIVKSASRSLHNIPIPTPFDKELTVRIYVVIMVIEALYYYLEQKYYKPEIDECITFFEMLPFKIQGRRDPYYCFDEPISDSELWNEFIFREELRNKALDEKLNYFEQLTEVWIDCDIDIPNLPEDINILRNVQELHLSSGCKKITMLPENIGKLKNLQILVLDTCSNLKTLPESIGQLSNLRELRLSGCESITTLPESIGKLSNLVELSLETNITNKNQAALNSLCHLYLYRFCTVPKNIEQLGARYLKRHPLLDEELLLQNIGCKSLTTLPGSIGQLKNLQKLYLGYCENLKTLPENIGQLQKLQVLNLEWCDNFKTLPESIGELQNLQTLDLSGCVNFEMLPESIGQLRNLKRLYLRVCNLTTIPESIVELKNLQELDLLGCKNLTTLPENIGQLQNLQVLILNSCENLISLPESIGKLQNLQTLALIECENLTTLPESISQLQNLKELILRSCANLTTLPENIGQLQNLRKLYLDGCENLNISTKTMKALDILRSSNCKIFI